MNYEFNFRTPDSYDPQTIAEYADSVVCTLQYWLDIHTNPEAWASQWLLGYDPLEALENDILHMENGYFSFNVKDAAIAKWAKNNLDSFGICDNCDELVEVGHDYCSCYYDMDSDEQEDYEESYSDASIEDVVGWFEEFGGTPPLTDYDVWQAMITDGFKTYQDALNGYIASHVKEIKELIEAIDNADSAEDCMTALLWANHCQHVNGTIVSDYGDKFGIDYKWVNSISQDGLESIFGEGSIEEFIEQF